MTDSAKPMTGLADKIAEALSDYRCQHTLILDDVPSDGLPLVDKLNPPGRPSIDLGLLELAALADHVADAIYADLVEAARAALEVKTGLQQRAKELAEHHGSIRAAARVLMVDHAYLYRLSVGEKDDPGDDLLRKLKLRRVVSYEPISEGKHG